MTSVGLTTSAREMEKQKRALFKRETRNVEKKSLNLMKKSKERAVPFKSATHADHARSMFDVFWGPSM